MLNTPFNVELNKAQSKLLEYLMNTPYILVESVAYFELKTQGIKQMMLEICVNDEVDSVVTIKEHEEDLISLELNTKKSNDNVMTISYECTYSEAQEVMDKFITGMYLVYTTQNVSFEPNDKIKITREENNYLLTTIFKSLDGVTLKNLGVKAYKHNNIGMANILCYGDNEVKHIDINYFNENRVMKINGETYSTKENDLVQILKKATSCN